MDILIADDSELITQTLTDILTEWGYSVISAKDGDEAWAIIQQPNSPKLLLLDWMMPGLSGVEICEKIRSKASASYYYIILLTSKTEKSQIYSGLAAGADDYLIKPHDPEELKLRLEIGKRILKLERELLGTMCQLEEQEERQNEFFAALTHDLRTPLLAEKRALLSIKEMSPIQWPFQLPSLLNSLISNNGHLINLVNRLLEKFHLESVSLPQGNKDWVMPYYLVEDCFEVLAPLAKEKKITLLLHPPLEHQEICVNPTEMKRVLTNLIGNAIEYDPMGTVVEVTIATKNDAIEIIISDNGSGIASEKLPYIFERYYSGNQKYKVGSGLGLNVCKNIIENYAGTIRVETAENIGTVFYITFPGKNTTYEKRQRKALKILIVDDQELARFGFQQMLKQREEFKVIGTADNGVKAFNKATELRPDVILMDIKMPEMDGYTATHVIKASLPETKIVMLSSLYGQEELNAAFNAGADGYCNKDISANALVEALTKVSEGGRWIDPALRQPTTSLDELFSI